MQCNRVVTQTSLIWYVLHIFVIWHVCITHNSLPLNYYFFFHMCVLSIHSYWSRVVGLDTIFSAMVSHRGNFSFSSFFPFVSFADILLHSCHRWPRPLVFCYSFNRNICHRHFVDVIRTNFHMTTSKEQFVLYTFKELPFISTWFSSE